MRGHQLALRALHIVNCQLSLLLLLLCLQFAIMICIAHTSVIYIFSLLPLIWDLHVSNREGIEDGIERTVEQLLVQQVHRRSHDSNDMHEH